MHPDGALGLLQKLSRLGHVLRRRLGQLVRLDQSLRLARLLIREPFQLRDALTADLFPDAVRAAREHHSRHDPSEDDAADKTRKAGERNDVEKLIVHGTPKFPDAITQSLRPGPNAKQESFNTVTIRESLASPPYLKFGRLAHPDQSTLPLGRRLCRECLQGRKVLAHILFQFDRLRFWIVVLIHTIDPGSSHPLNIQTVKDSI